MANMTTEELISRLEQMHEAEDADGQDRIKPDFEALETAIATIKVCQMWMASAPLWADIHSILKRPDVAEFLNSWEDELNVNLESPFETIGRLKYEIAVKTYAIQKLEEEN